MNHPPPPSPPPSNDTHNHPPPPPHPDAFPPLPSWMNTRTCSRTTSHTPLSSSSSSSSSSSMHPDSNRIDEHSIASCTNGNANANATRVHSIGTNELTTTMTSLTSTAATTTATPTTIPNHGHANCNPDDYDNSYQTIHIPSLSSSSSSSSSNNNNNNKWEDLIHIAPSAAREMLQTALGKSMLAIQKSASRMRYGTRRHSDYGSVGGFVEPGPSMWMVRRTRAVEGEGNGEGGGDGWYPYDALQEMGIAEYFFSSSSSGGNGGGNSKNGHGHDGWKAKDLPPFSSLSWLDRQLVREWRTLFVIGDGCGLEVGDSHGHHQRKMGGDDHDHDHDECVHKNSRPKISPAVAAALDISFEADTDHDDKVNCTKEEINDEAVGCASDKFEQLCDDAEFEVARQRVPKAIKPPTFRNDLRCYTCSKLFFDSTSGMVRRHHCRLCGRSFCHTHSAYTHKLPHLGYDPSIPERVCESCKTDLDKRDFAERILWRLARCRDYLKDENDLIPYFEPGIDTAEDIAWRIAQGAIAAAKRIPLGAQAYVAIETVDNLRKHGLKGIYALVLRKEFMAAADLLKKVTGIEKNFPMSVHDLTAAIFYAFAQHKAVRGNDPEREHLIHSLSEEKEECSRIDPPSSQTHPAGHETTIISSDCSDDEYSIFTESDSMEKNPTGLSTNYGTVVDETDAFDPLSESVTNLLALADEAIESNAHHHFPKAQEGNVNSSEGRQQSNNNVQQKLPFVPVCQRIDDATISSLLFYSPLALYFVYAESEVDMQLLAAQQGWQLLYAHLEKDSVIADRPASALFLNNAQKIACFAIRGTASTNDVVTDIRAMPVPFPDDNTFTNDATSSSYDDDWMPIIEGQGLALCGMARAATHLFRENIAVFVNLVKEGYRIRITGHSLGGGVAALMAALVVQHFEQKAKLDDTLSTMKYLNLKSRNSNNLFKSNDLVRVYSFGTPSCVDERLAKHMDAYVTNAILHDDVVPRLTPTSIRNLIKHLLFIKETWVKIHLNDDITAIADRAARAWAPRWRGSVMMKKQEEVPDHSSESSSEQKSSEASSDIEQDIEFNMYDGDVFYEAEETLIESDDESVGICWNQGISDVNRGVERTLPTKGKLEVRKKRESKKRESAPFDEPPDLSRGKEDIDEENVLVEELPLPRMFVPGKIAHIYTHRGGYKVAAVPRAFKELRRISLAGNMLTDHMSQSYYEALLEVQSVRKASKEGVDLPRWAGFAESSYCSCCSSKFTWASTSSSLAQEIRDKHNCRSCGKLVCGPCSQFRTSLPELGLGICQLRVCDTCYYNHMGRKKIGKESMTRSYCAEK